MFNRGETSEAIAKTAIDLPKSFTPKLVKHHNMDTQNTKARSKGSRRHLDVKLQLSLMGLYLPDCDNSSALCIKKENNEELWCMDEYKNSQSLSQETGIHEAFLTRAGIATITSLQAKEDSSRGARELHWCQGYARTWTKPLRQVHLHGC